MPGEVSRPGALPPALLARVGAILAQHAGMDFPPHRWPDLERAVIAAGAELHGEDASAWLARLNGAALSAREFEAIVCHAAVGETYFFRDPALFEVLHELVLSELLRGAAASGRQLRIWSAGCCTGEEAYSIAMMLDRALPGALRERVSVMASDINPRYLAHARRGVYGPWSFRAAPEWMKYYFTRRDDGRFAIDSRLRTRVHFFALNLAQEPYPQLPGGDTNVDIIVCRNVLMYFEARKARETMQRLRQHLCEGGWLFVGPAEMSTTRVPGLETVVLGKTLAYRRIECAGRPPAPVGSTPPAPKGIPEGEHFMAKPLEEEPAACLSIPAGPLSVAEAAAQAARRLADAGDLAAALECCERAIENDRLNEGHHFMRAVILRECGEIEGAAASLQRALYLDPEFVMAHFALGHLRVAQARTREALRHFAAAHHYASRLSAVESVAYSEGVNAGRFVHLCATACARLVGASGSGKRS